MRNTHTPDLKSSPIVPVCLFIQAITCEIELQKISDLFTYAQYWKQPWVIVSDIELADYLLLAVENTEDFSSLLGEEGSFKAERIIVYSEQPHAEARWHLQRRGNSKPPSALEFTILLKEIGKNLEPSSVTKNLPKKTSNKAIFDWREKLKIVCIGSVGSGKTTAVSTICKGDVVSTEALPSDQFQMQKKTTTIAMDFGTVPLNDNTKLYMYGAPGQRRFDFMTDVLLNKALGIIILVSNKNTDSITELDYYLNNYQKFLRANAAIIGVTHNDINPLPSLKTYNQFIQSRGESWPVLKVDVRKNEDITKLVNTLLDYSLKCG